MKQLLTRTFLTLAVAAIGLPFISPAPAHSASITTLFASDNGGKVGGAVYFDLTTMGNALTITGFETNVNGTGVPLDLKSIRLPEVQSETSRIWEYGHRSPLASERRCPRIPPPPLS